MIGPILQFQDLQRLCRPDPDAAPPRLATVVRWAEQQGIPFKYDGNGGIFTTVDALNHRRFRGTVEHISPATGSEFSLRSRSIPASRST